MRNGRDAPTGEGNGGTSRPAWGGGQETPSHVVILRVLQEIGGKQHDGLVVEVLPPMRNFRSLGYDVACLVHNRSGAIARIFVDHAFGDVDDGGAIGVAVPRHYAARLNGELAHAEVPAVDIERPLGDINRGDDGVGHANGLEINGLAGV